MNDEREDGRYGGRDRGADVYVVDYFDKKRGELHGLPQVIESKPTNITDVEMTSTRTYSIETVRHRELGDYVFLVAVDGKRTDRLVLPPKVVDAIVRQRDALASKLRKKLARAQAAERKAAGIVPTHLNDPAVRRKALKARKAKAAVRRERRERRARRGKREMAAPLP